MKKLIPLPGPQAAPDYTQALSVDVLARTIWGEARGEGVQGMEAVAAIVLNRLAVAQAQGRFWWGNTIIQICQKAYQFSCWNKGDANFVKVQTVTVKDAAFATAMRIAARAVIGKIADRTGGATHYHAKGIVPKWTTGQRPTAEIGRHVFYRLT